jgi:Ca-activated chloride channel family protein
MREKGICRGTARPWPWVKIKQLLIILLWSYACLLLTTHAYAASPAREIMEGNRYYNQEKYDNALEKYKAAGEESPDSDIVHFNSGAAQYKRGQYEEAIDSFTKALNTEDEQIESDATYNIANAKYKLGSVNADKDLNMAVSQYRESLDYYKRAMEMDAHNREAKYNHELVERELKVLLDKLKNQQQQQQDDQDQDKKDQQESDESQAKSDKEKKGEEKQQQESGKDQEMKEDRKDQAAEEKTGQGEEQQKEENGEMTPEEAQMLLEAYGAEEKEALRKEKRAYYPDVLKDW